MPLEGVNSRIRESAISETDLLTMSSGSSGSKVALPAPVLRSIFCLIRRIVLSDEGLEDAGCEDNYIVDEKGKYNDSHTSGMVRACSDLAGPLGKGTQGLYIIAISLLHRHLSIKKRVMTATLRLTALSKQFPLSTRTFASTTKMPLTVNSTAKMPSGYEIPLLGFGPSQCSPSVKAR